MLRLLGQQTNHHSQISRSNKHIHSHSPGNHLSLDCYYEIAPVYPTNICKRHNKGYSKHGTEPRKHRLPMPTSVPVPNIFPPRPRQTSQKQLTRLPRYVHNNACRIIRNGWTTQTITYTSAQPARPLFARRFLHGLTALSSPTNQARANSHCTPWQKPRLRHARLGVRQNVPCNSHRRCRHHKLSRYRAGRREVLSCGRARGLRREFRELHA